MERLNRITGHFAPGHNNANLTAQPTSGPGAMAKPFKAPVTVVVTGAAGNIAYSLLYMIAEGNMLGPSQPINLRLLEIPQMKDSLQGVAMELTDGCFPLLASITATTDYETGFSGADIAMLIGARPRGKGMVRADLLKFNGKIFEGQGQAINKWASRDVKVLVVGNPCNTNALVAMVNAPDIPKENFTALTRLDQHRAVSVLASRTGLPVSSFENVVVWGNHSKTMYPDITHGFVIDNRGHRRKISELLADRAWVRSDFVKKVSSRGSEIIKVRGKSSAASAAVGAVAHVRSWIRGTPPGEWVSMSVLSDGSYGVPKGIIYSFPCTCENGKWKIVQGLPVDDFSYQKMQASAQELLEEKSQALAQ
jgi:malate dehydrogenase